ncbi:nuclear transport factor 2 family protein [Nocardia bovistercoris]|uniref:Nuclear transport factor 2 family protein n=1 Tax=Nocardia bovistercoris TaxID=2785916 RepID=A0A931I869_9NOCA|nr:nuclear transport factor 2 family protein [Nocardia bovistercoris]MBH0776454.1 nuclear transport factor 2 family protein [Nocardia bovistercoris]
MSQHPESAADLAAVLEREAIRELKARYCRFLDTKDEQGWRTVFTADVQVRTDLTVATSEEPAGSFELDGVDAFVDGVLGALAEVATVHHCHTPEITLTSPTTATGIWAMADWLLFPDGNELRGAGHYHETYVKVEGAWRISSLHLTRTVVQTGGALSGIEVPR